MKLLFTLFLVLLTYKIQAQTALGFGAGGNFSQVSFKNSSGTKDKSLRGLPGITATVLYHQNLTSPVVRKKIRHVLGMEAGYKSAKFEDKENSLLTTWQMQYITTDLSYYFFPDYTTKVGWYLGGGPTFDMLISGTQTQGFNQFNITKDLAKFNISIGIESGINYRISKEAYTSIRVAYLRGLNNLEKDPNQHSYIHSFRITALVFFNFHPDTNIP